jgi:hypothetical protein
MHLHRILVYKVLVLSVPGCIIVFPNVVCIVVETSPAPPGLVLGNRQTWGVLTMAMAVQPKSIAVGTTAPLLTKQP